MPRLGTLKPRLGTLDTRSAKLSPKQADPHYATAEHRAWRDAVLKRAGMRCEGVVDGERCGRGGRLYADHIVERRDGGADLDLTNGQALCPACHSRKTATVRQKRNSVTF